MNHFPTPHLEKLLSTFNNEKLPLSDKVRIEKVIEKYHAWIKALDMAYAEKNHLAILPKMVKLLNEYKIYIELELIFNSTEDFLYRQKGQLKLDNSIIEEFIPRLMHESLIPGINELNIHMGPTTTFSAVYFATALGESNSGGGMAMRTKDQDFAISKKLYLKSSYDSEFKDTVITETNIAFVVTEIKTNLDKTMFQEACVTASDVKKSVSGAKYFLLCEWLDMLPVSTAPTDIEEILILRKAKRLN